MANNRHVFAVIDDVFADGLDEIKVSDIDDTCGKCVKFQNLVNADGCDVKCPLYDIKMMKDIV